LIAELDHRRGDPDGPAHIEAVLGGEPIEAIEFVSEAGAGGYWEDWKYARDENVVAVSEKARARCGRQ